jgi:hypothetical protein
MLLSDWEIKDAIWPLRSEQGKDVYVSLADRNIAKAQLKKVDDRVEEYFDKEPWMTHADWQSLLKEVE